MISIVPSDVWQYNAMAWWQLAVVHEKIWLYCVLFTYYF